MREAPRAVILVVFTGLTLLLVYPAHRPYLHPDQDLPVTLPLYHMALPSWVPRIINMYGSALPNLVHLIDAVAMRVGRVAGWWDHPIDLLVAWCLTPWPFRVVPRLIAMTAGLASLIAVYRIVGLVANRGGALVAPTVLGTWLLFVREHHHGLYDAPASGCAMLALWAASAHLRAPSVARIVAAGALAGLATSFKYNLAPIVPAVVVAAVLVGHGWRRRTIGLALVSAAMAFLLSTPEVVVDHLRWRTYLAGYIPLQHQVLSVAAAGGGNRLFEGLVYGIGWIGLALASIGLVAGVRMRDRTLLPVATFGLLYAAILMTTPLALGRYILPIAGPLAVAVALAASRAPSPLGIPIAALAVGVGLPACIRYVAFLAIEDTRVEAARMVQREWARGGRVVFATNPVLGCYVYPDVVQLPRYDPMLSEVDVRTIASRAPRCVRPLEIFVSRGGAVGAEALREYAGMLVVTADPPAPGFVAASTPPEITQLLEREATLVADLLVERTPGRRRYEVLDLNLVPYTGLESLIRPGPRLRFWRVPGD